LVSIEATKRAHSGVLSVKVICFCGEVDGLEFVALWIAIALSRAKVVAKLGEEGDVKGTHHFMVFVDQVVAVELQWGSTMHLNGTTRDTRRMTYHVEAVPRAIVCENMDDLTGCKEDCVLQTSGFIR
jgi:hypothetical protein